MTDSHSSYLMQHVLLVKWNYRPFLLPSRQPDFVQREDTKEAHAVFIPDNSSNYATGVCCLDKVLSGTQLRHKYSWTAQHGTTTTEVYISTGEVTHCPSFPFRKRGFFKGIFHNHVAEQTFILCNISIFLFLKQTFNLPHNSWQKLLRLLSHFLITLWSLLSTLKQIIPW